MNGEINMNKKQILVRILLMVGAVALIIEGLSMLFPHGENFDNNIQVTKISSNQEVRKSNNGMVGLTNKGDTLIMKVHLPKSKKIDSSVLCFFAYHVTVKATYKDETIYSWGQDYNSDNKLIGLVCPQIPIPNEAWGNDITVVMNVTENNAFSRLGTLKVYEGSAGHDYVVERDIFAFLISFTGIVVGIGLTIALFHLGDSMLVSVKGACLGLSIFIVGIWIFTYYGIYNVFVGSNDIIVWNAVEYFALFCMSIPIEIYVRLSISDKKDKKFMSVIIIFNILFVVIATFLNYFNIVHFNELLNLSHITQIISILIMTRVIYKNNKDNKMELIFDGFIILVIFAILDTIRYNIWIYTDINTMINSNSFLPLGLKIFVIIVLVSYLNELNDTKAKERGLEKLKNIAYYDSLTKVYNRTRIQEILQTIKKENKQVFTIIYFDINSFKTFNDNKGHLYGDQVIKHFAKTLNVAFGDIGALGRMGGDEFIVIIQNKSLSLIENRLKVFSNEIKNDKEFKNIYYDYGVAISNYELPLTVEEACHIADEEMYKMKKNNHRVKEGDYNV